MIDGYVNSAREQDKMIHDQLQLQTQTLSSRLQKRQSVQYDQRLSRSNSMMLNQQTLQLHDPRINLVDVGF
jgi:hypothetical protein